MYIYVIFKYLLIIDIDAQYIVKSYLCIVGPVRNVSVTSAPCGVALIQDIPLNL